MDGWCSGRQGGAAHEAAFLLLDRGDYQNPVNPV